MQKFLIVFLLILVGNVAHDLACSNSYADMDTETESGNPSGISNGYGSGRGGGGGRRGGGNKTKAGKPSKNPGVIRGNCIVIESKSNPFTGPCVNLLLVLKDKDGNEVERTRTTVQGDFEISTEPSKLYQLDSGSRFYAVVPPNTLIHGGDQVSLKLQQKE